MNKRFVVDTSVFLSAMLSPGKNADQAVRYIIQTEQLVFCDPLLNELEAKMRSPKFSKWVSVEQREKLLRAWTRNATLVDIKNDIKVCDDPEDDMLFEAAFLTDARAILTLDKAVLALHPWQGIEVLKPADFLQSRWVLDRAPL